MDLQEFEKKYHFKIVKPLNKIFNLPVKEYVVTSALYNYEDDGKTTVFAIKALDYNLENKHWFTIRIGSDEFEAKISDFEIVRDGWEEFKPKIIDEFLLTCKDEDENYWLYWMSQYVKNGEFQAGAPKTETLRFPKNAMKRQVHIGIDEYMFTYKSVFDIERPSIYVVTLPEGLNYREHIEEYIKQFRQDILNNQVSNGINLALVKRNQQIV